MYVRSADGQCAWAQSLATKSSMQVGPCGQQFNDVLDQFSPCAFLSMAASQPEFFQIERRGSDTALAGAFPSGARSLAGHAKGPAQSGESVWLAFREGEVLPDAFVRGWPLVQARLEFVWGEDEEKRRALVPDEIIDIDSAWVLKSFVWHDSAPADMFSKDRITKVALEVAARTESEVISGRRDGKTEELADGIANTNAPGIGSSFLENNTPNRSHSTAKHPMQWSLISLGCVIAATGGVLWWRRKRAS